LLLTSVSDPYTLLILRPKGMTICEQARTPAALQAAARRRERPGRPKPLIPTLVVICFLSLAGALPVQPRPPAAMRVAPIGTDPQDYRPLSGFHRRLEGTGRARANRSGARACAGLVNAVNWERGRPGPDLALVAARLVTAGEVMARESMSGRMPPSSAALPDMRRSCCPPGSARAWFPAPRRWHVPARGSSKDDRRGE
jgi:hypothetical protein